MRVRFRQLRLALLLLGTLLCAHRAPAEDSEAALVQWLDQVADDGLVEQSVEPIPADPAGAWTDGEVEEVVEDGEATDDVVVDDDQHSRWPDPHILQGFYGVDPTAFDHGETPPYCRGCQRLGCTDEGCDSCGGGCIRPTWFADAEFLYMGRSRARRVNLVGVSQTVVISNQLITFSTVDFSTRDLNFHFEPGMRLTLGRYLGTDFFKRVHSLEFGFFGLANFNSFAMMARPDVTVRDQTGTPIIEVGPERSRFPNSTGGFSGIDLAAATYSSSLNNYELNYRVRRALGRDSLVAAPDGTWQRRCTPGFTPSFLFGFRTVSINESFFFHTQGARNFFSGGQLVASETANGDYFVRTTNNLFGFQIGGDLVQQYCRFNVGLRGKTGLYANYASQRSLITSSDPLSTVIPVNRAFGDSGQHTAVLTEFGFIGNWHVAQNVNLRAAYDFMWVTGIANAPLQLLHDPLTGHDLSLHHAGIDFFQGVTAGCEIFW